MLRHLYLENFKGKAYFICKRGHPNVVLQAIIRNFKKYV